MSRRIKLHAEQSELKLHARADALYMEYPGCLHFPHSPL